MLLVLSGCGEDTPVSLEEPPEVDALTIICKPLAPEPGEQAQLSIQSTGRGDELADYYWSVSAGSLVVENGLSVPWHVPDATGTVSVQVIASIGSDRDTLSRTILIGNFEKLNTIKRLSMKPVLRGGQFFFVGADLLPNDPDFIGFHVYQKGSVGISLVSRCRTENCDLGGGDFLFYPELDKVLASMVINYSPTLRRQQRDALIFPFYSAIEQPVNISDDSGSSSHRRKNQHTHPYGSADLDMIVWQENISGLLSDGTDDLINIRFYRQSDDLDMQLTTNVDSFEQILVDTFMVYVYWDNILPMITPQEDHVLFFRDTTRTFEPVLIPIEASGPDTSNMRALKTFSFGEVRINEQTVFQWNPTVPTLLGFIDRSDYLCYFDYVAESVLKLDNIGKVFEFVWSPNGDSCAVVTETGVSLVDLIGNPTQVFQKERPGDNIVGINWSSDPVDPELAFRVVRKGKNVDDSWSSIVIYSFNNDDWYYATPTVNWDSDKEPSVDYTWMRVIFKPDGSGFYAPIPSEQRNEYVQIYHSFE
ncbi:MAG: hypothetical protein JSV33_06755 [bacterium]|nr:MAG: hypothetical protein JSV33_06755 [bacterium]